MVGVRCARLFGEVFGRTADADIVKSVTSYLFAAEDISSIDNQRVLDDRAQTLPVDLSKIIPFRQNQNCIRAIGSLVRVFAILNLGQHALSFFNGLWIVRFNRGSLVEECFGKGDRGCKANVIRIRLKCQPPYRKLLTANFPQLAANQINKVFNPILIDLLDFFEERKIATRLLSDADKSLYVLGEAKSTKAYSRIQKSRTNTGIQAHSLGNFGYVRPDNFAEVRDHVDKRYFHRQKGVGGMLDQLCRIGVSHQQNRLL